MNVALTLLLALCSVQADKEKEKEPDVIFMTLPRAQRPVVYWYSWVQEPMVLEPLELEPIELEPVKLIKQPVLRKFKQKIKIK